MTVHVNNAKICGVYYGSQEIQRIYYGDVLVYVNRVTVTLNVTPPDAEIFWTVDGQSISGNSVTVAYGKTVGYTVTADGYLTETGSITATKNMTVTLNMTASDFPREWGKFTRAYCTLAVNEEHSDWLYGCSLHFENGVLPVVVGQNGTDIIVDKTLYEAGASDALNSVYYSSTSGKWVNAAAADEESVMIWRNGSGENLYAILYATASMWGWPNNSVITNAVSFSLSGNTLRLIKDGAIIKTFTVYV